MFKLIGRKSLKDHCEWSENIKTLFKLCRPYYEIWYVPRYICLYIN